MNHLILKGRSLLVSLAIPAALLANGALGCAISAEPAEPGEASQVDEDALGAGNLCPDNGTGLFAIDYGQTPSEWNAIIAKKPSFVILGDSRGAPDAASPKYFHDRNSAIRVIAYIPMNYAHAKGDDWLTSCPKDYTIHHQCDNTPESYDCTQMNIGARIKSAMDSGYDGVFFDETPADAGTIDYVHDCAAKVKSYGRDRLVIMNPGTPPPSAMFNDDVDIVSVEHQDSTTSKIAGYGLAPWRWLSVEDAVPNLATAKTRFDNFRAAHGYWYDGAPSYGAVPSWFGSLADYIQTKTPSTACTASGGGSGSGTGSGSGGGTTGPVQITVKSIDLDHNNQEITGMWTVVDDGKGTQKTGFTPLVQSVTAGAYTVSVGNYQNRKFDHWESGSKSPSLSVTATSAQTLRAYYHTL